jgi:hypothetical protein
MIRSRVPAKLPTGRLVNSDSFEESAVELDFCLFGNTVWSLRCAFMVTAFLRVIRMTRAQGEQRQC